MPDMDDPSKDKSLNFHGEDGGGFPIGMKVLAIDSNLFCLKLLVTLLQRCKYQVTATTKADEALTILKDNKEFDLVITDVKRPDMDGFQLLEIINGLQKDLPVVMLSANDDKENVMRGIRHGAMAYLLKPIRLPDIKTIWQHVVRKKMKAPKRSSIGKEIQCGQPDHSTEDKTISKCSDITTYSPPCNDGFYSKKKSRVKWTTELHRKFVDAVEILGVSCAIPKQIHELMGVKELTRDHVASHLQKYRTTLKKQLEAAAELQGKSSTPRIRDNCNGASFQGTYQDYILNGPASHFRPPGSSIMNFGTAGLSTNVYNQLESFKPASFPRQNQNGFTGYQGPVIQPFHSGQQLLQNCSRNSIHPQIHISRPFYPNQASTSYNQLPPCNLGNVPQHFSVDRIQNSLIEAQNGRQMCTADPVGIQGHQNIDQVPMLPDKGKKSLLTDATEENRTTGTILSHNTSENLDMEGGKDHNPCNFMDDDIRALLGMIDEDAMRSIY